MKKTTIRLPQKIWRDAHVLALDEGRELQEVVAAALTEYLARQKKGGAR